MAGGSFDAVYTSFDLDGRLFLPSPSPRFKPSVIGGITLPFLDFYVTPHWSIDLLALYRWNRFDHLEAGAFDDDLPSDLSGDGVTSNRSVLASRAILGCTPRIP